MAAPTSWASSNPSMGYVAQLKEVGVGPEQVMDWRQEQIALAEPVVDAVWLRRISIDDLIGTDARTPADESLDGKAR